MDDIAAIDKYTLSVIAKLIGISLSMWKYQKVKKKNIKFSNIFGKGVYRRRVFLLYFNIPRRKTNTF